MILYIYEIRSLALELIFSNLFNMYKIVLSNEVAEISSLLICMLLSILCFMILSRSVQRFLKILL